jgi:hypothetical protein
MGWQDSHVTLLGKVPGNNLEDLLPVPAPWPASNEGGLLLFAKIQNTQHPSQASALVHSTPESLSAPAKCQCVKVNRHQTSV